MSRRRSAGLLAFVVLFGFMARAATHKAPLLDHHAWRQADTATISRNFARERFNVFYPQIDSRGGQRDGYVQTGLEVLAFAAAAISLLAGFHHETGRLLSTLCFVGSCLLVWTFVRRRYGDRAGFIAAFLYAFGFPLALFIERAFMNEALLIMLSFASLVAAQRVVDRPARERSTWDPPLGGLSPSSGFFAFLLILFMSLIAAIKLPYLIIWGPVAGLFLERYGWRAAARWELWLMAVVSLGVGIAWYQHAAALGAMTGLSFGMTDKLFSAETVLTLHYPWTMVDRLFKDVLGPIGFVGMLAALGVLWAGRRWCELLGLAAFAAYVVIASDGNAPHDYYQLAIMPVAPMLATVGVMRLAEWFGRGSRIRARRALVTMLALAAVSTFVRSVSAHSWYEYDAADVELCRTLSTATSPQDRVVNVGDRNPWLLYCLDRKGWLLLPSEVTDASLRTAREQGARLVVIHTGVEGADAAIHVVEPMGPPFLTTHKVRVFRLGDPDGVR